MDGSRDDQLRHGMITSATELSLLEVNGVDLELHRSPALLATSLLRSSFGPTDPGEFLLPRDFGRGFSTSSRS